MVGNLQSAGMPCRIVVDIKIGTFVKAVLNRSRRRCSEVVMYVCKPMDVVSYRSLAHGPGPSHTVWIRSSPGNGGMLCDSRYVFLKYLDSYTVLLMASKDT